MRIRLMREIIKTSLEQLTLKLTEAGQDYKREPTNYNERRVIYLIGKIDVLKVLLESLK